MRTTTFTRLLILLLFATPSIGHAKELVWRGWAPDIFIEAQKNKRLVLLDLEAVWCHWCHVMEEKTYGDPRVEERLAEHFITVRVDQDSAPDLSNRYGDWGWPATIIFAPDGTELVKLRGYFPAERMISLLDAVIADPTPGPSVIASEAVVPSTSPFLSDAQRTVQVDRFVTSYDEKNAGWGSLHRYIDTSSMDYALSRLEAGDLQFRDMAIQTLDAARALIDPAWGGVYQYSDTVDWSSPHFEKIMWYQAQYIHHYAQAYALWGRPADIRSARQIANYLSEFWTNPEGAFYTSQDADVDRSIPGHKFYALDDAERRALGRQPRIDKNIYARENGWAVQGLVALYNVSGELDTLSRAERAAEWVIEHRSLAGGGFRHGSNDTAGPYLGDTLAMGRASLDLYAATGRRKWLRAARDAGRFIEANFKSESGGFRSSKSEVAGSKVFAQAVIAPDEQVRCARFFNLLSRYTGEQSFELSSAHALKYLTSSTLLKRGRPLPGMLLAEYEATREPIHITIVGHKDSAEAEKLHAAARNYPASYKRVDWWDKREGPLPNPDVTYPELDRPAAFACSQSICSLPVFSPDQLKRTVAGMLRPRERRSSR